MKSAVLVSIVIPAYKPQFFEKALISAMLQDYPNVEIVVCDDCRNDGIVSIIERHRASSPFPVRYFYNETSLYETGNLARGIREARGEYVKFLYDDDLLMPGAVSALLGALQRHPSAVMASARRRLIDEHDQHSGESLLTLFPFKQDVLIEGRELVSFLGQHIYNFIGEPSSVMCRRADVLAFGDGIMSLEGRVMEWLGDITLYIKLLRHGDLIMLAEPLSCFRVSSMQFSQIARDTPHVAAPHYARYRATVQALGWLRPPESNGTVKVATLAEPERFHDLHLADYFGSGGVLPMGNPDLQAWTHPSAYRTPVKDWLAQRVLTPAQQSLLDQRRQCIAGQASVGVWVLAGREQGVALDETVQSLQAWAQATTSRLAHQVIDVEYSDWVAQLNAGLQASDMDWLLILRAGDQLLPSGTLMLDQWLAAPGDVQMVYCDELYRTRPDYTPALRPSPNLDLLLSHPLAMAGHWLLRREGVLAAGGFDASIRGAIELDLILRLIEVQGLEGIRHLAEPLLLCDAPARTLNDDESLGLSRHLRRRGYTDASVVAQGNGTCRIDYAHPEQPFVSIMVLASGSLGALQRCLDSVLAQTRYPFFELLIADHGLSDAPARSWLEQVQQLGAGKVRVVAAHATASAAQALNQAALHAHGDYLLVLEGDTVIIQPEWLEKLLNHGQRGEVAVVGPRLVTPDGRVRHAGLVGGLHGLVGAAFNGVKAQDPGYMQRLMVDQNYSAVMPACMLVRKGLYLDVGGFDPAFALGEAAGFDLCRRVARMGYLVVWTPHATVVQDHAPARSGDPVDEGQFYARWQDALADDPAYNANLTLSGAAFELEARVGLTWRPLAWRPLPVVLAYADPAREAQESRVMTPLREMINAGLIEGVVSDTWLSPAEIRRYAPDVVVIQDTLTPLPLHRLRQLREQSGAFIALEVQAFLSTSPAGQGLDPQQRWNDLSDAAGLVDCVIVPTPALAEAFAPLHADVRMLQTRLGVEWGGLPFRPAWLQKPRIGCAVEASVSLDPQLLTVLMESLIDRVDWVLWGDVTPQLQALAVEVHDAGIGNDPQRLAALQLDLALAPLGGSGLDGCRSALPLLQHGACGHAVICSDTPAFRNDLPVCRVQNTPAHWNEAIERHLSDPAASRLKARQLQQQVRQQWLFEAASAAHWQRAWCRTAADPLG